VANADLISDMSIPANQYITLVPAANGTEYSAFAAGTGLPQPVWSVVPSFLNEGVAVSVNLLSTYVTPTSGVTLTINSGTLPAGWTFGNGTAFAYSGVGSSAATPMSVLATLISNSNTAISNTFFVNGIATSLAADTTPPTVPTGVAASGIGQTVVTLTGLPSSDPNPAGGSWSGLANYSVAVTGVGGSPFTISAGTGNQPTLSFVSIGAGTGSGTITQGVG